DGDITGDELTELATLREVRTKLRRLDLSTAPDIDWPDM
ncbi:tail fiber assembly protein, partial [Citrobacter freundii]